MDKKIKPPTFYIFTLTRARINRGYCILLLLHLLLLSTYEFAKKYVNKSMFIRIVSIACWLQLKYIYVIYVDAFKIYKKQKPRKFMRGTGKSSILNRITTSIETPSDYCSVWKRLLFYVLQKTSPYIRPHGRVVPTRLIQQTVPSTGSTPTWRGGEDSVRRQT